MTPAAIWTQHPRETPMLVGWVGGPKADAVSNAEQFIAQALRSLERIFSLPHNPSTPNYVTGICTIGKAIHTPAARTATRPSAPSTAPPRWQTLSTTPSSSPASTPTPPATGVPSRRTPLRPARRKATPQHIVLIRNTRMPLTPISAINRRAILYTGNRRTKSQRHQPVAFFLGIAGMTGPEQAANSNYLTT